MRKNISLYIADRLVDIDDNSFILFNYTMEELSNPTIVKNSFSKQITLPGTANNNAIFGHYYKLDRVTQYGGNSGVYYDAMKRIPFVIYNERNDIVEKGYCKLDKVTMQKGRVQYSISLYGILGLFFYGLKAKEDGSIRTLADLKYLNIFNNEQEVNEMLVTDGASEVLESWKYLENPDAYVGAVRWANIINFAPCYNGIPSEGFNADKTLKSYSNIPIGRTIDGVYYTKKLSATRTLTTFSNPHSEWELKELRWYLQRPIVSIRAIFEAICLPDNNGGYEVELDSSFFNKDNHLYWDGWVTLPMISLEGRDNKDVLIKALQGSLAPTDYLVSFAKMTGLVFVVDKATNKVVITPRNKFFSQDKEIIDLTERIDIQSISLTPHLSDSRIYQFGNENIGEWAESYREKYGKEYGIQRVNTGNEFSEDVKVVTDGISFKEAIEVVEKNHMYWSDGINLNFPLRYFRLPLFEAVKAQLWNSAENTMKEVDVYYENPEGYGNYPDNSLNPNADWLPKVQLHEAENKETDGSNVLLIFNEVKQTPNYVSAGGNTYSVEYELTRDHIDMETLNEGVPCWGGEVVETLKKLPSFRRSYNDKNKGYVTEVCEWGMSEERAVTSFNPSPGSITLYDRFWKRFQADRYDDDAMVMTCKVNLKGLEVDQSLLGRFFYYGGSIFCLNKITNHSLTTHDDTECEFVRVQDTINYTI